MAARPVVNTGSVRHGGRARHVQRLVRGIAGNPAATAGWRGAVVDAALEARGRACRSGVEELRERIAGLSPGPAGRRYHRLPPRASMMISRGRFWSARTVRVPPCAEAETSGASRCRPGFDPAGSVPPLHSGVRLLLPGPLPVLTVCAGAVVLVPSTGKAEHPRSDHRPGPSPDLSVPAAAAAESGWGSGGHGAWAKGGLPLLRAYLMVHCCNAEPVSGCWATGAPFAVEAAVSSRPLLTLVMV